MFFFIMKFECKINFVFLPTKPGKTNKQTNKNKNN